MTQEQVLMQSFQDISISAPSISSSFSSSSCSASATKLKISTAEGEAFRLKVQKQQIHQRNGLEAVKMRIVKLGRLEGLLQAADIELQAAARKQRILQEKVAIMRMQCHNDALYSVELVGDAKKALKDARSAKVNPTFRTNFFLQICIFVLGLEHREIRPKIVRCRNTFSLQS